MSTKLTVWYKIWHTKVLDQNISGYKENIGREMKL